VIVKERDMTDEMVTPCYVIGDKHVTYQDDWCYGRSMMLGSKPLDDVEARQWIKAHIRECPEERNGLPLYYVSDHGNVHKARAIRLRRVQAS